MDHLQPICSSLGKEYPLKALVYWYLSGGWRLVCHPVTPSSTLTLSLCRLMFIPYYATLIFNLCKSLKSTLAAKIKRALMDAVVFWHNVARRLKEGSMVRRGRWFMEVTPWSAGRQTYLLFCGVQHTPRTIVRDNDKAHGRCFCELPNSQPPLLLTPQKSVFKVGK